MKRISSSYPGLLLIAVLLVGVAQAHEGHAPLPTKGVQVDVPKGLITLSPAAHKSLGLQTGRLSSVRWKKRLWPMPL